MGKIINAYRLFTATVIKARATIPNQGDMTVVSTTVECVDITMAKIKNGIGGANFSLGDLSQSGNINLWSGFGPITRSIINGVLTNALNGAPHDMGEFAGYDHLAAAPNYPNSVHLASVYVWGVGATAIKALTAVIGQPKYLAPDIVNDESIVGVALALYNGATFLGAGITDLNDCAESADLTAETSAIYSDITITGKIFLVDSLSVFNQNGENIRGTIPGLSNFNFNAIVLIANYITVSPEGFMTSDDSVLEAGDCSFAASTGYFEFPTIHRHTDEGDLLVTAKLIHQIDGEMDSIVIFDGAYTANTPITGDILEFSSITGVDPGPPYANQGWHVALVFETGT